MVAQAALDRLTAGLTIALVIGLVWFLVEPLLLDHPPDHFRSSVLGGLVAFTLIATLTLAVIRRPSRLAAALELDARFRLQERVTTALALPEPLRTSPAGDAVLADAEKHATGLRVRERFPIRMPRSAVRIPLLAGLITLVAFVYHPIADSAAWAEAKRAKADADAVRVADSGTKLPPADRKPGDGRASEKAPGVKELEAELDRLERQNRPADPDAAREQVAALTPIEDRARAAERDRHDRLTRVEQKLRQLDALAGTDDFKDGPARELNEALAGGDLKKAGDEAERLRKKLKDPALDPKEAERLAKQLDRMADELRRLSRDQEKQDKLQQLIDQAKKDGRDAEGLQRELDRLKAEAAQAKELEQLAESLGEAKKCLAAGQKDDAAKQLERAGGQLRDLQGQVKELGELQGQIQRLERMKSEAAGAAEKADGGGPASGARPENANAATKSVEARQPTPFDPTGRRTGAAGSAFGPGFTKKSPAELGPAIPKAAQSAQDAAATQPLTRDEKEAVGEFFREPKK
jgi:hypothetical protein